MSTSRRQFFARSAQGAAAAACAGSLWYALIAQQAAAAPHVLRPPGALATGDFAASCAKCGRCVTACPYGTLKLADLAGHGAMGLPWFAPRDMPCYMCPDLPCVKACPTGALAPSLTDVAQARMGLAVIDGESCLSWQGLRCEVCYRACPLRGTAIRIEPHPRGISKHAVLVPVVSSEACTGCGLCENACPTEVASVRIVQPALVQGKIGEHYRLGGKPDASEAREGASTPPITPPSSDAAPAASSPITPPSSGATPAPSSPSRANVPGLDYLNRGVAP